MIKGICVFIHRNHLSWWKVKNNKNSEKIEENYQNSEIGQKLVIGSIDTMKYW